MREPFFGPNAKPMAIQFGIGLALYFILEPTLGRFVYYLSCTYLTGSCL